MADTAYIPIEEGQGQPSGFVKNAEREVRLGFVRKVYGILTAQLLLTVLIAAPFQAMDKQALVSHVWMLPVSMALTMGTLCAMGCCPSLVQSFPGNYIMLGIFTAAEAVMVGFAAAMYSKAVVMGCLLATMWIFGCMSLYAWTTKSDFTGAGPYLFGAMSALCIFGFVMSMMSAFGYSCPLMHKIYAGISLVLFTLYIVFDTQMMIGGNHSIQFSIDDYVFAAINLYLDIINIFLSLLQLFGNQD